MQQTSKLFLSREDGHMTGGRMTFEHGQRVRILTLNGNVSDEEYEIEVEKADRKGHIALIQVGTDRKVKVNQRRVLTNCAEGEAFVIESGDKYRAVCPKCSYVQEVTGSNDVMTCPIHGETQLHWKEGERPMAEATTTADKKEKSAKKEKPPAVKKEKPTRDPITVNFDELKNNGGFELWTKRSVQFDHEKIDVQAHVLLITGDNPRKFCFNTYDGTLGKKGKPIPVEAFLKDEAQDGDKKPWYAVSDVDKAKTRLIKDGYELQK